LAIQDAIDSGSPVYVPPGNYKITQTINLSSFDFFGAGSASTVFEIHGTYGFMTPLSSRYSTKISGFKIIASGESCDNYSAIKTQSSFVLQDRGVGFKFSHIEIGDGNTKHFGAVFLLTDCFRFSIQNVGITNSMNALVLYGQVVQTSIIDVNSNFDCDPFETSVYPCSVRSLGCGVYVYGSTHSGNYQIPESLNILILHSLIMMLAFIITMAFLQVQSG
jgi:hypothetical protein